MEGGAAISLIMNSASLKRAAMAHMISMMASLSVSVLRAEPSSFGLLTVGECVGKYEITSDKGVKVPVDSIKEKFKVFFYFSAFDIDSLDKLKAVQTIKEI